jgi:hypothetical protein
MDSKSNARTGFSGVEPPPRDGVERPREAVVPVSPYDFWDRLVFVPGDVG